MSVDHSKEGLVSYEYECDLLGVTLTCWFEYEAAERGSREFGTGLQLEPDYPATWTLMHVYLPGSTVDIAPVLMDGMAEEIEEWVAEKADREYEEDRWDAEIEAYEDRKAGY